MAGRFASLAKQPQEGRNARPSAGQASSSSNEVDLQLERLRHENAALKRLIERTNQPQADPPAGPQHGMAVSDTEAAMRHENAALKRRMEMIQQQMDAMKAAAGGGSEGAHAQIALVHSQLSAAQQGLAAAQARSEQLEKATYTAQQAHAKEKEAMQGQVATLKHENESLNRRLGGIDARLREGESETARGKSTTQTLQEHVSQLRQQLDAKDAEVRAAWGQAGEGAEGIKNLQNRVNQLTTQLQESKQEGERARSSAQTFQQKLHDANGRMATEVQEAQRLRPVEERAMSLQAEVEQLRAKLEEQARGHDQLLTEANVNKQEVVRLGKMCNEQNAKIGDMEERLSQQMLTSSSKDETLSNMAASRYKMHAELEGKTNELTNTKEEAQRYNMDLRETIAQLQVAQNRVKTLERRVREMDAQLSELQNTEPELIQMETELEGMRMQLISQEEQERYASQLSELLAEKEIVLNDALRRQGKMIEEMEDLEAEKKKYQREAERLRVLTEQSGASLRELQASLEEQSDAMAFSEKMLLLSREQTESLHSLRESLRDKEEMMKQKDAEMEAMASDFAEEASDLRDRIVGLTDANRMMQQQLVDLQGMGIERDQFEQLQKGYEEARQQLALMTNARNRTRDKVIALRNAAVRRIIAQWGVATLQAAFSTWLNEAAGDQTGYAPPPRQYAEYAPRPPPRDTIYGSADYSKGPPQPPSIALDSLRPSRPWDSIDKGQVSLEQYNARSDGGMHRTGQSAAPTPPPPSWSQSMQERDGAPEVIL